MAKYEYTKVAQHGIPAGVKLTPMMEQYVEAKGRYPEALLFFRMGDFYELFFQDAELAGLHLGLTVTSRNKESAVPEPMSGFPHHQLSNYLAKALEAGFKVAVCDQLSDPTKSKLVERGITQVVTPGVVLDTNSLQERDEHFLVAVAPQGFLANEQGFVGGELFGIAALDVSTGAFKATEVMGVGALRCELSRLDPKELLLPSPARALKATIEERFRSLTITDLDDETFFNEPQARRLLMKLQSETGGGAVDAICEYGYGVPALPLKAAGAAVAYVIDTQQAFPTSVHLCSPYRMQDSLILDETAAQNLELLRTLIGKRKKGSLLGVLDRATTPMGARRIRRWMSYPLLDPNAINTRLDAVELLKDTLSLRGDLRAMLKEISDLERLNTRASLGKSSPRELGLIRDTLARLPDFKRRLEEREALRSLAPKLGEFSELTSLLQAALTDEPPSQLKDGNVIRQGLDPDLDELLILIAFALTTGNRRLVQLFMNFHFIAGFALLADMIHHFLNFFIRDQHPLSSNEFGRSWWQIQHVSLTKKLVRPHGIENGSTINFGGYLESNTRRNIGFDHTSDYVHARPLRCDNAMNAGGASQLRNSGNGCFHIRWSHHHQIRQLINHHHDIAELVWNDDIVLSGNNNFLIDFGSNTLIVTF